MNNTFDKYAIKNDTWFLKNKNVLYSELKLVAYFLKNAGDTLSIGCGSGLFEMLLQKEYNITIKNGIEPSKGIAEIERALHDDFLQHYTICQAAEKSPAFSAYTDFLIDHVFNSPYPVAAASLLPCFWVYYKTGEYILKNTVNNNPYRKCIDTYSRDEYWKYTRRFIHIEENLEQKVAPFIREQMADAFTKDARHELRVLEEAAKQ